jgi:hypothetical protein
MRSDNPIDRERRFRSLAFAEGIVSAVRAYIVSSYCALASIGFSGCG